VANRPRLNSSPIIMVKERVDFMKRIYTSLIYG
jgi:hypothetical protein